MARPVRKKIKFNEESLDSLLQEIYNDSHNIRSQITTLFNKWENKVKENADVAGIGTQIVNLIRAMAKNQDQKIMLLKYIKEVVYADLNGTNKEDINSQTGEVMTPQKRNELLEIVAKMNKQ